MFRNNFSTMFMFRTHAPVCNESTRGQSRAQNYFLQSSLVLPKGISRVSKGRVPDDFVVSVEDRGYQSEKKNSVKIIT